MNESRYIGCCGAYCKTCQAFTNNFCKGCKIGFDTGERDIGKAKCKIKLCCFRDNNLASCADCTALETCNIIGNWHSKKGYKYRKYKQNIEFIRENGYEEFLKKSVGWKGAYGALN